MKIDTIVIVSVDTEFASGHIIVTADNGQTRMQIPIDEHLRTEIRSTCVHAVREELRSRLLASLDDLPETKLLLTSSDSITIDTTDAPL